MNRTLPMTASLLGGFTIACFTIACFTIGACTLIGVAHAGELQPVRIARPINGHIHPALCVSHQGTLVVTYGRVGPVLSADSAGAPGAMTAAAQRP